MEARITRDVLESYVFCKYKSYLKLLGQQGDTSDYERLRTALRHEVRLNAIDKIRVQHQEDQVVSNIVLTTSALAQGPLFVLGASIEDEQISLSLDGLKKVPGVSKLGQFLYIPMLFCEGQQVYKQHRLLLELHALFLPQYQGVAPSVGIIWHSRECKATTIHLNPDPRKAKQILIDLKTISSAETPPKLILNDHCQICEFRQRCHDQAVQEDNLSLLRGVSEKEIKGYNRKGILTITQLAHTFRPRRKRKRARQETQHRYQALQALALRDKRIYVLGTSEFPNTPVRIYLDVESNPDAGFVYLIGLIVAANELETHYSFWADTKNQESDIFEQFVAEVTRHEHFIIFCYGNYERTFITRMRKTAKSQILVDKILNSLVNTLSYIYNHIYFPTYSNSLKEIGPSIGYSWTESDASGIQSIVWRSHWEVSHYEDEKQKLLVYNLEDCAALQKVTDIVQLIMSQTKSEEVSASEGRSRPPIALVEDIERLTDYHTWGDVKFVFPDYKFVNNRAYFDYQRERVYIRTNKTLRKSRVGKKPSPNRKLKATQQVTITASECPICKSANVISGVKKHIRSQEPRVKRAFDIVLTSTGMRCRVIEYRTSMYQCLACDAEFVPDEHQRLDRYLHGLKSWVIFQHVAYRTSLETISKMAEEFFGIRIHNNEIYVIKSLMADRYRTTYQRIFANILSGKLLHIDETEVKLQHGKGYVWVFTNMEEVVYMYKPTREGDFLHKLLQDFHGVLISDFYAVYDGIDCSQQKCLIHLMRDINQELLSNPFDEDLKLITQPFGILLRKIITTIDEYGLQKRYLIQHKLDVEQYYQFIREQNINSEVAEALRMRLIKYQHKLFTFLDHDGVPWNNNNAEHAIKQFAYYRENTVGSIREAGLNDYLVLLSVCQTCKYKGVSFLRFLLSEKPDIDAFCRTKQHRPTLPSIELYPEGFVHPNRVNRHKKKVHQEQGDSEIPDPPESDNPTAETS
jgi:predicted RecB family nuclease